MTLDRNGRATLCSINSRSRYCCTKKEQSINPSLGLIVYLLCQHVQAETKTKREFCSWLKNSLYVSQKPDAFEIDPTLIMCLMHWKSLPCSQMLRVTKGNVMISKNQAPNTSILIYLVYLFLFVLWLQWVWHFMGAISFFTMMA